MKQMIFSKKTKVLMFGYIVAIALMITPLILKQFGLAEYTFIAIFPTVAIFIAWAATLYYERSC